ncbi:MAG: tRNA preQ1(34) S-adenosylmethionine ribosyltransferase-isomerase QueA [Myxococcales bacterium]|nr:tRNA preQ1(34) S-adenosylmethionine ribosyltransferase-isomerase QueA [Myxococcales bacterium]
MDASELDYELPPGHIAQSPLRDRHLARLLLLNTSDGAMSHATVGDLPHLIKPALFVVNNTRVFPARLLGHKTKTGGKVELLLVERDGDVGTSEEWRAYGKASQGFAPGMELSFPQPLHAKVMAVHQNGLLTVRLAADRPIMETLQDVGMLPLPGYIRRAPTLQDAERYQTVFAKESGAVAAPTAGLHFDHALLDQIAACGHQVAEVTLHVGIGTFAPLRTSRLEDHHMHAEHFSISKSTATRIREAKAALRPVVAVGTTVARTLESVAAANDCFPASSGQTTLFVYPPFQFRCVDVLMTNFHLPRSTLLAMVMAFGGKEQVKAAYRAAVQKNYRFFSYGDAMLLCPGKWQRRQT